MSILACIALLLAACARESPILARSKGSVTLERQDSTLQSGVGTVQTLAGPLFCKGVATLDGASIQVRSLAVDPAGRVFFDTGKAGAGLIGRVEPDGSAGTVLVIPVKAPKKPAGSAPMLGLGVSLATDRTGGLFVGGDNRVLHLTAGGAQRLVAGQPNGSGTTAEPAPADESLDPLKARFKGFLIIATDEAGDVFVGEQDPRGSGRFRIRFLNRSTEPVIFYSGSPGQMTVAPGTMATIVGASAGKTDSKPGIPATHAGLDGFLTSLTVTGSRLYVASYRPRGRKNTPRALLRLINIGGAPVTAHGRSVAAGAVEALTGAVGAGFTGKKSDGVASAFSLISGLDTDGEGNLFLADEGHHRISKLDVEGRLTTFGGVEGAEQGGFNGNDKLATKALLNRPRDVKVGPEGRVYISDRLNGQIRFVDRAGTIRAAPGNGIGATWRCPKDSRSPATRSVDSGGATGGPSGVAGDSTGSMYVALIDGNQIKRIDRKGALGTLVGDPSRNKPCGANLGCPGFSGDGNAVALAQLNRPSALALRPGGLYILDSGNNRVRFVNLGKREMAVNGVKVRPGTIQTVAGNGNAGSLGDGGKATAASLGPYLPDPLATIRGLQRIGFPTAVLQPADLGALAVDGKGSIYVSDPRNQRIRKIDRAGLITTAAGEAAPQQRSECCKSPGAIRVDREGNLYVGDRKTFRVWFINTGSKPVVNRGQQVAPGEAVPVAGTGASGFGGDGGKATEAFLLGPSGLATDGPGNLYVAEYGEAGFAEPSGAIRKVDTGGIITSLAGTGQTVFNGDGLRGQLTNLNHPAALDIDSCGNLLIADSGTGRIRRLILTKRCHP